MSSAVLGVRNGIAIVNFAAFRNATARKAVATEIINSFKRIGFVYLVNHGLEQSKLDDMFTWSKKFFDLPLESKMLAPHPASGAHHRGYSPPGREKIVQDFESSSPKTIPHDLKESFEVGRGDSDDQPNIWLPDGVLPGFKEQALSFFWDLREVQLEILRALALGFDLPEDYFMQYHEKADNQLRLLHYPSISSSELHGDEANRITAHSDFDTFTLLFQDDVGGLEVEDPSSPGVFHPATPIPGSVVVNVGDFLMRWSNDTVRSTIHRVRATPQLANADGIVPDRYSIPCFCSVDLDIIVDCIPGTYSDTRPKKYEPVSARDYVNMRLAANY